MTFDHNGKDFLRLTKKPTNYLLFLRLVLSNSLDLESVEEQLSLILIDYPTLHPHTKMTFN